MIYEMAVLFGLRNIKYELVILKILPKVAN